MSWACRPILQPRKSVSPTPSWSGTQSHKPASPRADRWTTWTGCAVFGRDEGGSEFHFTQGHVDMMCAAFPVHGLHLHLN